MLRSRFAENLSGLNILGTPKDYLLLDVIYRLINR